MLTSGSEAPLQHVIKPLVRTANCKIDHCSCGAVHVSIGGTTVRITDGAARELRDALTRALLEIDGRQSFAPTPAIHLVDTRGGDDDDGGPQLH